MRSRFKRRIICVKNVELTAGFCRLRNSHKTIKLLRLWHYPKTRAALNKMVFNFSERYTLHNVNIRQPCRKRALALRASMNKPKSMA